MSNFKIVLTGIFAAAILIGIIVFASSKSSSSKLYSHLVVWGTIDPSVFESVYKASSLNNDKNTTVSYEQKNESTFDEEFVNALAEGRGPDVVILRDDSVYKNRNKLFVIPYKNYDQRTFKSNFIEAGEVFLGSDGIIAFPFIIDPMVMYWNRDMFSSTLIPSPPKYWDEVYSMIDKMTRKDSSANITQSMLSLGEWKNITNAKEILSTILLQAGTQITARTATGVVSVLNYQYNYPIPPSQSAVSFYTQFSNPTGASYTWNRSLPQSFNFFLSGSLGTYFGFASEIFSIQQKNPNLNFDVTYIPQIRNSPKNVVFGRMFVLAIVKQSKRIAGSFGLINALTEQKSLRALEVSTNLPPVRRDMLSDKPTDPFKSVFYDSALISKSWIDPDRKQSTISFQNMIESITSGRSKIGEALNQLNSDLIDELK